MEKNGAVHDIHDGRVPESVSTVDSTPTSGSGNLITSGGVKSYVDTADAHAVLWNQSQNLSASEKKQGRLNIGAINGDIVAMRGWNQLVRNGNFVDASGWSTSSGTLSASGNVLTYTPTTFGNSNAVVGNVLGTIQGHKYFVSVDIKFNNHLPSISVFVGSGGYDGIQITVTELNTWVRLEGTFVRGTGGHDRISIYPRVEGWSSGDTVSIRNLNTIDLTALFGAGNEPSTVAEFRSMFPAEYYPYALPNADCLDNEYQLAMDGFISPTINGIRNYWDGTLYHRRIARVDLGSLEWTINGGAGGYTDRFASSNITPYHSKRQNAIILGYTDDNNWAVADKSFFISTAGYCIYIRDSSYTSASSFKTAMSGVFLYYELATEQTLNIDKNGLRYELLWTNASPTSDFPATTSPHIQLDLSGYKFVLISYNRDTNATGYGRDDIVRVGNNFVASLISNNNEITVRGGTVSSNSIRFGGGGRQATYKTSTSDNSVVIPYQIYGIR